MSDEGARSPGSAMVRRDGETFVLPGIASVHSHAFQRALRGRAQRRAGSFFGWRAQMYRLVERLCPDTVYDLARQAYLELLQNGVCAVGEFHYVHHQPDGTPYQDRLVMAERVIAAARDVGIRVALLRVVYARAGFGRALEPAQRRFCDADVDQALSDTEALAARFADDPCVSVGVAPHSVRAVPEAWLRPVAEAAAEAGWPLHMHVAEQRREVHECLAEYGRRPVELLADRGVLRQGLTAVHATHLTRVEARMLGDANAGVCLCRTTERDLGDGLPDVTRLMDVGVRLSVGADSHAESDPFAEARAIELDERSRCEARTVALHGTDMLRALSAHGYEALRIGPHASEDAVVLRAGDPALVGSITADLDDADLDDADLDDAIAFGATGRAVQAVHVAGQPILSDGCHPDQVEISRRYQAAVRALFA